MSKDTPKGDGETGPAAVHLAGGGDPNPTARLSSPSEVVVEVEESEEFDFPGSSEGVQYATGKPGFFKRQVNLSNAIALAALLTAGVVAKDEIKRGVLNVTGELSELVDNNQEALTLEEQYAAEYKEALAEIKLWEEDQMDAFAADRISAEIAAASKRDRSIEGIDAAIEADKEKVGKRAEAYRAFVNAWYDIVTAEGYTPGTSAVLNAYGKFFVVKPNKTADSINLPGTEKLLEAERAYDEMFDDAGELRFSVSSQDGVEGLSGQIYEFVDSFEKAKLALIVSQTGALEDVDDWEVEKLGDVAGREQRMVLITSAYQAALAKAESDEEKALSALSRQVASKQAGALEDRDGKLAALEEMKEGGLLVNGLVAGAKPIVMPVEDCLDGGDVADSAYCEKRALSVLDCGADDGNFVVEVNCANRYAVDAVPYTCDADAPSEFANPGGWMDEKELFPGLVVGVTPRDFCEVVGQGSWAMPAEYVGTGGEAETHVE